MEIKGNNPEIFTYQFGTPDIYELIPLKLTFYGGTDVYISFKKEHVEQPFDLISKLIESGINTTVTFDTGDTLKFNEDK